MRKWIIAVLLLLAASIAAVYVFIPSKAKISAIRQVNASPDVALRILASEWSNWWPGQVSGPTLTYGGITFTIGERMYQSFDVDIRHNDFVLASQIVLLPIENDSFAIEWRTEQPTGSQPLTRLRIFNAAGDLQARLGTLLDSFSTYIENSRNIYGTAIEQTIVKDSLILVATLSTPQYPSISDIYASVDRLRTFASAAGAKETNFPMLNIDSSKKQYITRVGLPVDTELDVRGTPFSIKRMVRGFLLVTETKGGPDNIAKALRGIERYMTDYRRGSPAIPYQSLVTNRASEPDSSKWITRIYYPVY